MASLTIYPESGDITTVLTRCNIFVEDADLNDTSEFDADETPTSPAIVYRIRARKAGADDLLSYPFSPDKNGGHVWPAVLFPEEGTWTVTLRDTEDDSQVASMSVTVDAAE